MRKAMLPPVDVANCLTQGFLNHLEICVASEAFAIYKVSLHVKGFQQGL